MIEEENILIGVLKEIKTVENRVCMTPAGVEVMKQHGHTVLVEKSAGVNSGFEDTDYVEHGAEIVTRPKRFLNERRWLCM